MAAYGQQTASTRSVCSVDGATRVLPATVDACGCEKFGHKQVHLTIILRGSDAFDPTVHVHVVTTCDTCSSSVLIKQVLLQNRRRVSAATRGRGVQRPNCSRKLCAERVAAMVHEAGTCREEFPVTRWSARLRKERSRFQPQRDDGTARDLVDRPRDPAIFATECGAQSAFF